MSRETGPPSPPREWFVSTLHAKRYASIGVAVGVVVAAAVYVTFVVLPGATTFSSAWFLVLAFVVASGIAVLVTLALVLVRVARLARTG